MQLGQILKQGLGVLVLGMGITLIALVLLIVIINIIRWLTNISGNEKNTIKENKMNDGNNKPLVIDSDLQEDEKDELIAVISASIAMMFTQNNQRFKVKKIKQIPSSTPKWNRVGRSEHILNRR